MIDWIKNINKDFPSFWKTYLSKFDEKSNRFVVLSMNTTGLDTKNDFILSIGCISVINNSILISDSFEINIMSNRTSLENQFFSDKLEVIESEGIRKFINYIENAVLIGHRINFDIEILNEALDKIECGRLKNEALDVEVMYRKFKDINSKNFAIDDLLKKFNILKNDRESSLEDAYSIALLFLKLKSRLQIL